MGRIRFRTAPLEGLPPAQAALVAAIRKVVEGSGFDTLDQLGAEMYHRPPSSPRRGGKRISEWARGAQFPQRDDLALLIKVCDRRAWEQVEQLFHAATFERVHQPHASASPSVLVTPATFWEVASKREPGTDAPVVGRVAAQDRLRELVTEAQTPSGPRVVVVEGPGGIGKTRLAVEAAESSGLTLIARTAVPLPLGAVAAVPRDRPVVLVVDDAHRCPDLGGVTALLGDPHFAAVSVIVTVRPGRTRDVLRRLGLDEAPTVELAPLLRADIDQIIQDRGFHDRGFRLHVVLVASGNPLLAHTACTLAAERHSYSWETTAELMRDLVCHRLNHLDDPVDQHRAVAVALAVLTSASDSDQVSSLAGSITMLPSETDRLDVLLEDLVDAGLADAQPYRVRPDAVAPVLAADALGGSARVRIRPARLLQALGRAAAFTSPTAASPSDDVGVFGLGVPAPRGLSGLGVDVNRLAGQVSTLADATFFGADPVVVALLDRGVRELLAPDADVSEWVDVLTLAGQIVPWCPALLTALCSALIGQWPPVASSWPFGGRGEVLADRQDIERFLQSAMMVAERAGRRDPTSATGWVLECAWLSHPALNVSGLTATRRAVSSLTGTDPQGAAETWDDVFHRREAVLGALRSWGTERAHHPPTLLQSAQHQVRSAAVADRVILAGLRPLLGMITEVRVEASPSDSEVVTIGQDLLPDDPRTRATLTAAVDVVEEILDRIHPADDDAVEALRTVAQLPFELRAEVVRSRWGSDDPLPDYAAQALECAAARITTVLATRWTRLPLMARHAAAVAAAHRVGRRSGRLVELAEAGDPVAAAAVTDTELARLQILLPIEPNRHLPQIDEATADALEAERREAAEHLGARTSLEDALALLDTIAALPPGSFENYLAPFARQVGHHLTDLDPLLARLTTSRFLADNYLLGGAVHTHPQHVAEWLDSNLDTLHIAELAILVPMIFPPTGRTTC